VTFDLLLVIYKKNTFCKILIKAFYCKRSRPLEKNTFGPRIGQIKSTSLLAARLKKIGRGGDKNGNYSAEPLHCALQTKHFKLCRVKGKGHMWLSKQKKGKFLALGWHISYNRPAHYIGIDADIGIVIDGSKKNSFKLDVGGMLACLSGGLTRIWEIKPL
jgi:hypothetical protein